MRGKKGKRFKGQVGRSSTIHPMVKIGLLGEGGKKGGVYLEERRPESCRRGKGNDERVQVSFSG